MLFFDKTKFCRVFGAARESHNEHNRNTLNHTTCSHKWWETLKGSIFGVKPSIPALRGPRDGLVEAPAEKDSLLSSQFNSKQCHEQFVTPLSCFPNLSVILWPSKFLSSCICFLICMGGVVVVALPQPIWLSRPAPH